MLHNAALSGCRPAQTERTRTVPAVRLNGGLDLDTTMHDDLVLRAERWLRSKGCRVVLRDPFKAAVGSGECPDALGWRDGLSLLIECKASRRDFLADAKKPFRRLPEMGMGDWRFYMAPPDVLQPADMPEGWGLLVAHPRKIEVAHGGPHGGLWWQNVPFTGHKRYETQMLVSALARSEWPPTKRKAAAQRDMSAWAAG